MLNTPLTILLIGRGGRESALAYKLSLSPLVSHIYVAPGNGGTASGSTKVSNIPVREDDFDSLGSSAQRLGVNLVVPGPDAPIVNGIEGHFGAAKIAIFAPTKEAAQLEGSKVFSKDFMARHHIPTAEYRNFTDYSAAKNCIRSISHRIVLKASCLAAGKGVFLPETTEEALSTLSEIMLENKFGEAGNEVVIEEFFEEE